MEEEEIDNWYEEEKQKCMDEYLKEIETTKHYEEAEKRYEEKLNRIINKYNQLMGEKIQNKKAGKFKKFVSNLKKRIF
jgi:aspartate/methionine/tyrosine aminotransferase